MVHAMVDFDEILTNRLWILLIGSVLMDHLEVTGFMPILVIIMIVFTSIQLALEWFK